MEIIFVIAAATGRTLVLPPREPMYLLQLDTTGNRYRGFADFFPIHTERFQSRVKVITFSEFLATSGLAPTMDDDPVLYQQLQNAADHCDQRAKSESSCQPVFDWMKNASYNSDISATHTCLVFDEELYRTNPDDAAATLAAKKKDMEEVCGTHRDITFWDQDVGAHPWTHFRASENEYRLLTHFYNIIHFANPLYDNLYKRFVRDALHYHDNIYCAAGKIVKAIQLEGKTRGMVPDANGAGGYSALHVRRGDLQYKKVKIPASEWYENTKEVWRPNEILYVATDERNKTFFDDLLQHHDLRFLDDYWDLAGLSDLDPNYMGMIDTVVASRGRAFAGTWFSTFSGYINRLRGYHGLSMMDSWYSFLEKKTAVHEWNTVDDFAYAFEWPDGWIGIDGDVFPSREKF
jgi:GDP-fucose protein O-fucosyltransferase